MFDAVLVLGKELRRHRARALRELAARSAAAAIALRQGAQAVLTLEAPLRGQATSGSELVRERLLELDVPEERILCRAETHSTREEALLSRQITRERGWRRLLVITSAYHVPRARHVFAEHFAEPESPVHAPEGFLRAATPQERAWIEAATPTPEALAEEEPLERRLLRLERLVSPLPDSVRWNLEMSAARLLRRV